MSTLRAMLLPTLVALLLSGCVVEARPVGPPPPCVGGRWIEGHYGPYGRWHPGHWRCPGAVIEVE